MASGLWFPNGMAITPDGVLLVVETFGNRVSAFDLTDDGQLSGQRVWAEFGPLPTDARRGEGTPGLSVAGDGACLDAEGGLWIADATGDRVVRVTEGGEITDEVQPGSPVYACGLGGLRRPDPVHVLGPRLPRRGARGRDRGADARSAGRRTVWLNYLPCRMAACRSQLRREITSSGISFGHAAVHSPMLVQPPKPSWSCWATMLTTRLSRSAWPCGSSPRWVTLAPTNSEAEPFGQAATQAPQPMQVATSNARSALSFGTGVACASGAAPVFTEM